jgi:transposase
MKKKRTYQAESVQRIRVEALSPLLAAGCVIALDVAKQKFVVALMTLAGELVKLFRFEHPTETQAFLAVVEALRVGAPPGSVVAAMEPTGTYGDAVRYQLVRAGVPVKMVSPKRTHDSREVFDGVPSLHDPKSAMIVGKLCSMGLATDWSAPPATRTRLRALVELRQHEHRREEVCFGRMEAMLARHWPEFGRWMDFREQKSALRLLTTYPSPALVKSSPEDARKFLRDASRAKLSKEVMDGVIDDARVSLGVPMVSEEEGMVRELATQALDAGRSAASLEEAMRELTKDDASFARLCPWMGTYTAAVLVTMCDPDKYATARQLEKACGLNLREKSSGEYQGRLSITKRGPSVVRQVLYMFALRMIKESPAVHAWYVKRRGYTEDSKGRAVVAVMRKLVRATLHVAKGAPFDASKLFDLRRLGLDASLPSSTTKAAKKVTPRTEPRPIARGKMRASQSQEVRAQ